MPPTRADVSGVEPTHDATNSGRRAEQRRGLAGDRGVVVVDRPVGVEQVLQFEHLAAAQFADRRTDQSGHLGAERRCEHRSLGEQEVAREDRHDVRPPRVHRLDVAARLGLVDHVVVVERTEVHEFDAGCTGHRIGVCRVDALRRVGRRERHHRTKAFATGSQQMRSDLTEETVLDEHGVAKAGLDPFEIAGQRRQADVVEDAHRAQATTHPA